VTGGYTVSNAASYEQAWSSEFAPSYPLYESPTWVAGAGTSADAAATCSGTAFTGAAPQLAQYRDGTGYDADMVCGAPAPQQSSFVMSVSPASATVAPGASTTGTVPVTESGSSQTVTFSSTGQPSGVTVAFAPASVSSSGSSTMTVKVATGVPPGTYQLSVTGTGASGVQSSSYALTVPQQRHKRH
jgi:hypothetical protein